MEIKKIKINNNPGNKYLSATMSKLYGYLFILFWASLSMIFGLFLFSNGFLVRRSAITKHSNCSLNQDDLLLFEDPISVAAQCLQPRAHVIILIVDALKYEFIDKFDDDASSATYHRNKLPVIAETLKKYPQKSRVFKFLADPPTTTMQRLKGITTGTLPTFIDMHDNFAADNIVEDNFIDQNSKKGNIFMGDDTWINLYPNQFLRQYPAPSFDVSDLDSVDNEVKKQIFIEIEKSDWVLLIGHMLGVDHCGHKHGMHHPEMLRKLNETNCLIETLIEKINKKTENIVLFVMGDHGMTDSGDHGGDSSDEVEAALFVYSTMPLIDVNKTLDIDNKFVVHQVDIVPTVSVILGNPIPFSNIGHLIFEAIPSNMKSIINDYNFIKHSLWKNIFQVQNYIDTYRSENTLDDEQFDELKEIYRQLFEKIKSVKNKSDVRNFVYLANNYFTLVRTILYKAWVQFDPHLILKGLLLFFCAIFLFFIIISGLVGKRLCSVLESSFLNFVLYSVLISFFLNIQLYWMGIIDDFMNTSFFFCGLIPVICFAILLVQNWDYVSIIWFEESCRKKPLISYLSRFILLSVSCGVFSNSFIIEENKILSYFLITLFCLLVHTVETRNFSVNLDKKGRNLGKFNSKKMFYICISPILVFIICCLIRSSSYFWRFREEQLQLEKEGESRFLNFVIGKAGSIVSKNDEICFVLISIALLALYITLIKIWLRHCGNLSGYSLNQILARFVPGIIVIFISIYWISKMQQNTKINHKLLHRVNSLPLLIYVIFIKAVLLIFYQPLAVFFLPKEKETISLYQGENSVPKLYEKMKNLLYKKSQDKNDIPIVYGLGTVYSACYVLLSMFLCLLYILLLGFVIAPSVILMNLVSIGLLYISAIHRINRSKSIGKNFFFFLTTFVVLYRLFNLIHLLIISDDLMSVSNPLLLCWFLNAEYFFYATGHQPSFSTIHWDAGFIGIDSSLQVHFIQAVLIGNLLFKLLLLFSIKKC